MMLVCRLSLVGLSVLLLMPSVAWPECDFSVRSIAGRHRADGNQQENIPELDAQLARMPFKQYRTIEKKTHRLNVKKMHRVSLEGCTGEVHELRVEPTHLGKRNALMMLDWRGPGGQPLLATKLNLVSGKTIFVGAEETNESSTILGLRLDCD